VVGDTSLVSELLETAVTDGTTDAAVLLDTCVVVTVDAVVKVC